MTTLASARAVPSATLVVDRYVVFSEFAAGGMASVHLAQLRAARGFRRTVAVKRLLPHLTRNQEFVLMLLDEARLASRISHPNVVTTLEVVQSESEVLLVMEYIHGESLAKLLSWASERGERIPVPMACAIVADVLHGLHAAHEATDERGQALGVVHRDVSPQNILVGLDGVPRVADFGVAKAAGRSQTTRDGILKGKLAYMAPEQLESAETSRVSDVFSAAVVLWEALAGERLFSGKNHAETTFKVLSAPVAPPSTRNPAIAAALDAVVMRGLARKPAERYATARDMALALEQSVSGVRSSDLARWVERVVGGRLDARLSELRAIEQSSDVHDVQGADNVDTQANTRVRPRSAPSSRPRYVVWAVLLLMMSALATLAAQRHTSKARLPAPSPPPPSASIPQLKAATSEHNVAAPALQAAGEHNVAPPKLQAATGEHSVAAPKPSGARVPRALNVVAPPESSARTKSPANLRVERSATRDQNSDCDPPFTIDADGHRLFKAACMQ